VTQDSDKLPEYRKQVFEAIYVEYLHLKKEGASIKSLALVDFMGDSSDLPAEINYDNC
jgi:hypothetical protein